MSKIPFSGRNVKVHLFVAAPLPPVTLRLKSGRVWTLPGIRVRIPEHRHTATGLCPANNAPVQRTARAMPPLTCRFGKLKKMNILVVTAHPLKNSLCGLFSETVTNSLNDMGHEVQLEDLYQREFDPVLSIDERISYYKESYDASKVLPEIEKLANSDALVIIFPTWWFCFPAILKGWFDRVWAPTVAYDHADDYGPITPKLDNLKKTFVVTTLGAPWWVDRIILGRPVKRTLRFALLGACARKCKLKYLSFYKCESVDPVRIDKHLHKIKCELKKFFKSNS